MSDKVLLTGFESFDQERINPSYQVMRCLDGERIGDYTVISHQLPCVFDEAIDVLIDRLEEIQPKIVICLGQAKGRAKISVERVAINIVDAPFPDNQGNRPIDVPIIPDGPVAYWSTLPIKAITTYLQQEGIPAGVSQTAGTYVCNQVFYGLMHWVLQQQQRIRAGFIHVPVLPEQVTASCGVASMPLALMVKGIRLGIQAAIKHTKDLDIGAGAID